MYLEYWGLDKHPFNNVPDSDMYYDRHKSLDACVKKILHALDKGHDTLAITVGATGTGKTMSMRRLLDTIDPDKFTVAYVTNPDMTFPQLLREIIGQLEGKACETLMRVDLLKKLHQILQDTVNKDKRVLVFIDEGSDSKPHNLENILLLTEVQSETKGSLCIIAAAKTEFAKRLESPRYAKLFKRVSAYCLMEGLDSAETMRGYIEHRLTRAGKAADREIYTENALSALWSTSEQGNPRTINRISALALKAAEQDGLEKIDSKTISTVSAEFMKAKSLLTERNHPAMPGIQPLGELHGQGEEETELPSGEEGQQSPPIDSETSLYEITPTEDYTQQSQASQPNIGSTSREHRTLSGKELEELASRLATERVKSMKNAGDTFEAWEQVRNDILQQLKKAESATTT